METGSLTVYSASAGSGKTYKLTGIYLELLFRSRLNYRKILAVTFTNKATSEMKGRILDELHNLASGANSSYLADLTKQTGMNEALIRNEAKEILYTLLHDYSRFSVSTIDSFFQKIIRAFASDIGLHSGFNTELDHNNILLSAVSKMIASASTDEKVRKWLSEYARANIEDEKSWDLKKEIFSLAQELFNEKFKLLSLNDREKIHDKDFLSDYISEIKALTNEFERQWVNYGRKCASICSDYGVTDDLFYRKGQGVPAFIKMMADGKVKQPNSYVREIERYPARWTTGTMTPAMEGALRNGLEETVKEALRFYDNNIISYRTAGVILTDIYALGILSDVLNQVRLSNKDENTILLSEAGEMIYLITEKDQAPFIYEKVGNRYEVYMIDEFQDTSVLQWKNFRPLIENSMSQGFDNLVVGDIKQSIYRWRNGDWKILGSLRSAADNTRIRSEPLKTNWRSCRDIIRFNNSLFSVIPMQIDEELGATGSLPAFSEIYSEAVQNDPGKRTNGYVRIEFVDDDEGIKWQEKVLDRLPSVIESFQDKGYRASDIGILVRDNKEGARVLRRMISYGSETAEEKNKYNYNIISSDSLLLSNAPVIEFMMAVLAVLDDPKDMIARAMMLRSYLLTTENEDAYTASLSSDDIIENSALYFPGDYTGFLDRTRYLPLWNITEEIIRFFSLGNYTCNVSWLSQFQDLVLHFSQRRDAYTGSFIEWWETEGCRKSLSLPEGQDAMRVLTIHKSKGLEFKIVILPFLSWNLDHKSFQKNILWISPETPPFNRLGIVPVRYKKALVDTIFARQYSEERYSAYLDNVNLLYVALTRAENVICCFAPDPSGIPGSIAGAIGRAVKCVERVGNPDNIVLNDYFDPEKKIFEFGTVPANEGGFTAPGGLDFYNYPVNENFGSLRLRLHGTGYVIPGTEGIQDRINHGKLMHEIFERIVVRSDVAYAVRSMVLDGRISENAAVQLEEKINSMLSGPVAARWFEDGNDVLNEASIIVPGANMRRPDRVILKEGKAIVVDFKFGKENPRYLSQIRQYRSILSEMGYEKTEAFLWYVDADKIITA